jgi:hypothetical protein
MARAATLCSARFVAILAGLAVAGCGLATTARPDPPPHVRPIDPDAEWLEIKASRAAGRTGLLAFELRPTLERSVLWGDEHLGSVRVKVVPYAPTKTRDAPEHINEVLARYRTALTAVGLGDLAQDLDVEPDRRASLTLAAGDYLVLSEARTGSGPTNRVWVWLLRARLEPHATAVVVLEDANRLCMGAWTRNGTRCRER